MKISKWRVVCAGALVLLGVVGGAVIANTAQNANEGIGELRGMPFATVFNAHVLQDLNLSQRQKTQVRRTLRLERPVFISLLKEARTTGKALRDAADANASEDSVQTLAAKQADADLAVIVEAQKTQAKVADLLTTAQLKKAKYEIDSRIDTLTDHVVSGGGPGLAALVSLGDKLGLSPEQKAKAKQIIDTSRAVSQPSTTAMLATLKNTEDSIAAGTFDKDAAAVEIQKAKEPLTAFVLNSAKTRAQLIGLLTAEQKAQLQQIVSARHRWSGNPRS